MKNLKVTKSAKAFILTGAVFAMTAFAGCVLENENEFNKDAYLLNARMEQEDNSYFDKTSVTGYKYFLLENDLVTLDKAKKLTERYRLSDGNYAEKACSKDETSKRYWQKIDKEEMSDYTGIARVSQDINYKLYKIVGGDEGFTAIPVLDNEYDQEKTYYVNINDPYELDNPQEYYYFNGERRNLVRQR